MVNEKTKTHIMAAWSALGLVYSKGKKKGDSYCSTRSKENKEAQIKYMKEHNIKSCEVVLTLGIREYDKQIYIAGSQDSYENCDNYFKRLQEEGIRVDLLKIHFNYPRTYEKNETPESWAINVAGGFEEFQELYKNKVLEIAKRYHSYTNRICCMNELNWVYRDIYKQMCIDLFDDLHKDNWLVSFTSAGMFEFRYTFKEIFDRCDFFCCNIYPHGSIKGINGTVADNIMSFRSMLSGTRMFINYCKTLDPEGKKPLWITETGTQDFDESLVCPSHWNYSNIKITTHNGEIQSKYLEALLLEYDGIFEGLCWFWPLEYENSKETFCEYEHEGAGNNGSN